MNKVKSQKGFTLVELLISTVLVGLLMVAIMNGFTHSMITTGKVRTNVVALNLAKERIEFLKQYEHTPLTHYTRYSEIWKKNKSYNETTNKIKYTILTTIIPDDQLPEDYRIDKSPDIIPIRVTVRWEENKQPKITKSISLETFYYPRS